MLFQYANAKENTAIHKKILITKNREKFHNRIKKHYLRKKPLVREPGTNFRQRY